MGASGAEQNLSEVMAAIEELISRHYFTYSRKFPEHQEFWDTIAAEEIEHAKWIRDLYAQSQEGKLSFNEKRFDKHSLLEFRSRLESMLRQLEAKAQTHTDALKSSVNLESMLLEKEFFTIFETDFPELKDVLKRLAVATQNHRIKLDRALKELP